MARPAKIWWNAAKNAFYTTIQGVKVRLAANRAEAEQLFHGHKAKENAPTLLDLNPVRTIFNLYLDYLEGKSAYIHAKGALKSFADSYGDMRVCDLRAVHVHRWTNAQTKWNENSKATRVAWVVCALNWAAKPEQRYITTSPLAGLKRPHTTSRGEETIIDPADHEKLYKGATPDLQEILLALRQTGTRPGNLCIITAAHCFFDRRSVTLEKHKTVGKTGKQLQIPMTDVWMKQLARLCVKHPTGPLYRTSRDRPWNYKMISSRVNRLCKQLGIKVIPYGYRHTVATELLMGGMPDAKVAQVLGHSGTAMIYHHYGHLGRHIQNIAGEMDTILNPKYESGRSEEE